MIGILDYRACNIGSVSRMISKVGGRSVVISDSARLADVEKIVLPGVGHFDHGIAKLRENFDLEKLRDRILGDGIPTLGICLGMQLLCKSSEEGLLDGLGYVEATVRRLAIGQDSGLKLPHMGWNVTQVQRTNPLIPQLSSEQRFYYVHSYHVVPADDSIMIASATYGSVFCAAFQQENIFGVQFHPEKSHRFGVELFRRFVEL